MAPTPLKMRLGRLGAGHIQAYPSFHFFLFPPNYSHSHLQKTFFRSLPSFPT
jgi:hypothetical protein